MKTHKLRFLSSLFSVLALGAIAHATPSPNVVYNAPVFIAQGNEPFSTIIQGTTMTMTITSPTLPVGSYTITLAPTTTNPSTNNPVLPAGVDNATALGFLQLSIANTTGGNAAPGYVQNTPTSCTVNVTASGKEFQLAVTMNVVVPVGFYAGTYGYYIVANGWGTAVAGGGTVINSFGTINATVLPPTPTIAINYPANGQVFNIPSGATNYAVPYDIEGTTAAGSTMSTAAGTLVTSTGTGVPFSPTFYGTGTTAVTTNISGNKATITLGPGTYTMSASDANNLATVIGGVQYGTANTTGATNVTFTVVGTPVPTITISSPSNNQVFSTNAATGLASVPYTITGTTPSGTLISLANASMTLNGSTPVVSFSPSWSGLLLSASVTASGNISLAPGTYVINANDTNVAVGNLLAPLQTANATPVTFTVVGPPAISISGPTNGQTFTVTGSGATATASVPYTIAGSTPAGTLSTATATLTSNGSAVAAFAPTFPNLTSVTSTSGTVAISTGSVSLTPGTYTLNATDTNSDGGSATASAITFTVVGPPAITIASPANGQTFSVNGATGTAAVAYTITGSTPSGALSTATASLTSGGTAVAGFSPAFPSLGSVTSTSGTVAISTGSVSLAPGIYVLNAIDTNTVGGSGTAAAVTFTVVGPPTISITGPSNNQVFSANGASGTATVPYTITGGTPTGTLLATAGATLTFNGSPVTTFTPSFSGLSPASTSTSSTGNLALAPGTYTLTATDTNNDGGSATSTTITFTVVAPPTIGISSPTNGQSFSVSEATGTAAVPYTITGGTPAGTLLATATATLSTNGSAVAGFSPSFSGLSPAGTSTTASASINLAPGTYTLTATDTNNDGGSATATAVTFNVLGPPTITITGPTSGQTFYISANATTAQVPFAISGSTVSGTTFASSTSASATLTSSTGASTAAFAATFTVSSSGTGITATPTVGLGAGTYTVAATDTNNLGGTATATPITFTVALAQSPTITISTPVNGQTYYITSGTTAAVSYTISGTTPTGSTFPTASSGTAALAVASGSAATGSVAGVAQPVFTGFGATSTSIGSTAVVNLPAGTYTLSASDTNNSGGTAAATPVTFTVAAAVAPAIVISAPTNGQSIAIPSGSTTATVTYTISGTTPAGTTFTSGSAATATLTSSTGGSTGGFAPTFTVSTGTGDVSTAIGVTSTVNLPAGTYTINATDTNNTGGTAAATPVTFTVSGGVCSAPTVTTTGSFCGNTSSCRSNTIWFNSEVNVSGLSAQGGVLQFSNSTISFTANGATVNLVAPSAVITFSSSVTQATSAYSATSNTWTTTVPAGYTGNVFLTGLSYQAPSNFSAANNTVTWSGAFLGSAQNMSVQWLWTATILSQNSSNYNSCGVKPVDSGSCCQYNNSDLAGTCESYKNYNCGTAAACSSSGSSSTTAAISGLYATGVSNSGGLLAGGAADPHYTVTASSLGSQYLGSPVVDPQSLAWGWVADTSSAQWITAPGGVNIGNGAGNNSLPASGGTALSDTYDYTTTFTMPAGATLGTAAITGTLSADDTVAIIVNGVTVTSNVPKVTDNQYNAICPFTLNSSNATFQAGVNTIIFRVANENTPTPDNPSGLYVQAISGTVTVPNNLFQVTYCANLGGQGTLSVGSPPTVTANNPVNGATYPFASGSCATIPVAFTAVSPANSGNIAGIAATLNGSAITLTTTSGVGSSATATGAASLSLSTAGIYTLVYTGTNAYGSAAATVTFTVIQVQPPTITINAPNNGATITIPAGSTSVAVPYSFSGGTTYGAISSVNVTLNGSALSAAPTVTGLNTASISGSGSFTLTAGSYSLAATDSNSVASATDTNCFTVVQGESGGGSVCNGGANNENLVWIQQSACSGQYGYNNGCNQTVTGGSIVPIAFSIFSGSNGNNNCWGNANNGNFVTDTSVVIAIYQVYSNNTSSSPTLYTYGANGPNPPYYSIANNQYLLEFPTASGSNHYQVEVYSAGDTLQLLGCEDLYTAGSCLPSACNIGTNFTRSQISSGNCIWFNSTVNVSGLSSHATTLWFDCSAISFNCGNTPVTLNAPAACIKFDPNCSSATTTFDSVANCWVTDVPLGYSGNVFLCGVPYTVPSGLQSGLSVNWTGCFRSDTGSCNAQWQWAASVYTQCSSNLNNCGVKPVDSGSYCSYRNSDSAGTPENYRSCVANGSWGTNGFVGYVSPSIGSSCWLDSSWNSNGNNGWGGWGW